MSNVLASLPRFVVPPKAGEYVLRCPHAKKCYPWEAPEDHWQQIDPPGTIASPVPGEGNLDVRWLAICQGCMDHARGDVSAVNYVDHFRLEEAAKGRWALGYSS